MGISTTHTSRLMPLGTYSQTSGTYFQPMLCLLWRLIPHGQFAPTSSSQPKVAIVVDLSDESVHAFRTALYDADWGLMDLSVTESGNEELRWRLEDHCGSFTTAKMSDTRHPLVETQISFKICIMEGSAQ
ncbi:hypothetical protein CR513_54474, partial [Mucuna pruriens]